MKHTVALSFLSSYWFSADFTLCILIPLISLSLVSALYPRNLPPPKKQNKISPSISTRKGSLLRVTASGFCYAINNGLSLGLLLDAPLSCAMCHRDPVVLDLHVGLSPSHAPTLHRCSGCWGGHPYPPGSGPGWWLDWSVCRLSLIVITLVSSPALLQQLTPGQSAARSVAPDQVPRFDPLID